MQGQHLPTSAATRGDLSRTSHLVACWHALRGPSGADAHAAPQTAAKVECGSEGVESVWLKVWKVESVWLRVSRQKVGAANSGARPRRPRAGSYE